jgi:hypothetical protein
MNKHRLLFALIAVLCFQQQIFAAENTSPIAEMIELNAAQQYQRAYELGTANLNQWEGEPDFDFLYGMAWRRWNLVMLTNPYSHLSECFQVQRVQRFEKEPDWSSPGPILLLTI